MHLILTINNKNIIKMKKKTNNSIKTIISVMTAKKKKEKKVMEEKRPSLPEVVTVRKHPRIPGVTLNRLILQGSAKVRVKSKCQTQGYRVTDLDNLSSIKRTPLGGVCRSSIKSTFLTVQNSRSWLN